MVAGKLQGVTALDMANRTCLKLIVETTGARKPEMESHTSGGLLPRSKGQSRALMRQGNA